MGVHDGTLLLIERTRLQEDAVRDAELAHVVHGRGVQQQIHPSGLEVHRHADHLRVAPDPFDVPGGVVVLVLSRQSKSSDGVQMAGLHRPLRPRDFLQRVAQFARAKLHGALERLLAASKLILGVLQLQKPFEPEP